MPIEGVPRAGDEPAWVYGADTPQDLRDLADEVMTTFTSAFPSRRECLGAVGLVGARELDDRARYDPGAQEVTIRIPATAPQLRVSLVHELAHHLEFSCPSHVEIREELSAAQGLSSGDWSEGPTWIETPSEQWATAVVHYVLEEDDPRAPIVVPDETLRIIQTWAEG